MNRTSLIVRFSRLLQYFPLRIFRFIEWPFLVFLDRRPKLLPVIFVLALPRSGSTVTYQALCHHFSVQYLSNVWNLLYQLPFLGGLISSQFSSRYCSDFKSQHGFVGGLDGPAEGLRFWQWWFDCGLSDKDKNEFSEGKRRRRLHYLAQVLSVLTRRDRPFVTAYLGHALAPDRVYESFSGAVLIRLYRDPVSNGLSLLKSMRESQREWFSVFPKECEGLGNMTEHQRVAAQVYWLNRRLDDAGCSGEMLTLHYEALCQNPSKELEKIRERCKEKGISVDIKLPLPDHFEYKTLDLESDVDAIKIRYALNDLENNHGVLGKYHE